MLCNTAAGISVLLAAAVVGKGGGRALGHWSGWLQQAVDQLSASDLLLINPTDAYGRCQLRWGSRNRESPAAGWPKGIEFHPPVTVACYATLVHVVSIAYSASVPECIGISFYLVGYYLFISNNTSQTKPDVYFNINNDLSYDSMCEITAKTYK